ncbi:hypothetical protein JCM19231_618 [Vibrio ishigakensis]|uniref:DUF692 domain-containing protein n=1 Tax=Vibrio ishigakensis TaxID=1481914 RepID=A0A0B8NXQ1_9VIBR|nr:hypothetical protein JCM19231_618 [Vibrio ishigakensis]
MKLSNQALGIGLRHPHLNYFESDPSQASWFEVHSENFFDPRSQASKQLHTIREQTNVSCHGIGLSLGSVVPISQKHLSQLQQLISRIEPVLVSDHLSWSENGGVYFNDLLPLPYTEEALEVFCRNVLQVQDAIKRPLLIENPSSYLRFNHSTIDEWEFLNQVQQKTDCSYCLISITSMYLHSTTAMTLSLYRQYSTSRGRRTASGGLCQQGTSPGKDMDRHPQSPCERRGLAIVSILV